VKAKVRAFRIVFLTAQKKRTPEQFINCLTSCYCSAISQPGTQG